MTESSGRERADARRNRTALLDAAAAAFAEHGAAVSVQDIADRAGVAVPTLYRRFGSKERLLEALVLDRLDTVVALGDRALAIADPWTALREFLLAFHAVQQADAGLYDALEAAGSSELDERRARIRRQIRTLAGNARRGGVLSAGVTWTDLALLPHSCVVRTGCLGIEPRRDQGRRIMKLALDGLRAAPD